MARGDTVRERMSTGHMMRDHVTIKDTTARQCRAIGRGTGRMGERMEARAQWAWSEHGEVVGCLHSMAQ